MEDIEIILLVAIVLIFIGFGLLKNEKSSENIDNYQGDYDGGHNKPDSEQKNTSKSNDYQGNYDGGHNKNISIPQITNTTIMHDLRNLTISSTNPCLIIYLLDQSGSMDERFGNASHTKAMELANAINDTIYEVGLRCIGNAGELKNRFEIAIIGYGKGDSLVQSAWEGQLSNKWVVSIKNIFEYPLGQENDKPIWIKPYAVSNTPMTKAFENAKRLCNDWINWGNHRDCHPPIIINITDGEATDAGWNSNSLRKEVEQIKHLRTNYGNVNILNIHISSRSGDKLLFPNEVNQNDRFANLLFEISTPLNENMVRLAQQKGYNIQNNARGYVFNGSASDLINFLNIGTPQ